MLPAGTLEASPHQLLHNGALQRVLDQARERFAYIIIDTPPVLAASEALVLAKHADATLVCAMRDHTQVGKIKQAHTRLVNAGTGRSEWSSAVSPPTTMPAGMEAITTPRAGTLSR